MLFEELGRGPVPGPQLSSGVLAALTILEGGTDQQKREWLPGLAKGRDSLVLAVTESDYGWDVQDMKLVARADGGGWACKERVPVRSASL